MNVVTKTDGAVVEISKGQIRGAMNNGVNSFKGVPYGDSTAGGNRFLAPQPVQAWTGVRDAYDFGLRAPQHDRPAVPANAWIRSDTPMGEDCLSLNVYTPALSVSGSDSASGAANRPVMVYLHGGGYNAGAGDAPGIDGSNLARQGDVVVVTVNHRLNVFGFCHFGAEASEEFADSGNAGVLDIVAALQWVRDNITAFGGDAGNVTIYGQSGGASKVAVLMTMPAAKGLFHKAIMQSGSSHLRLATSETTARALHALLAQLDMPGADPAALQKVPTQTLLDAYRASVAAAYGNDSFRPVVDGRALLNHPFDLESPDLAADIPLMIGSCETEKSFYDVVADPATLPMTRDQLFAEVKRFVGIDAAATTALIGDYESRRPGISMRDLFNVLTSDHMYRRNVITAAERKSAQGGAPAYLYEFTWKTPVLGGMLKSPHTLCIPFVFGTVGVAEAFVGAGPEQDALSAKVMGAWLAFARTGNPNHDGLSQWSVFDAQARPTMVFDNQTMVISDPKPEDRLAINNCPAFISDEQWSAAN
jgi:para-nitrobenzyl esterase